MKVHKSIIALLVAMCGAFAFIALAALYEADAAFRDGVTCGAMAYAEQGTNTLDLARLQQRAAQLRKEAHP